MSDDIPPFELLYDQATSGHGAALPGDLADCYGSPFPVEGPELWVNFAVSYDGRVSFGHPDALGAEHVSGSDRHDRWLMALLRARADAVLLGDGTLAIAPDHLWTHGYIYPECPEPFTALRASEGRSERPLTAFVSLSGRLPLDAEVFAVPAIDVVVATTERGAAAARADGLDRMAEVLGLGERSVDVRRLLDLLASERGCRTILCEGGPRLYGSLLAAGVDHDLFLTLSPLLVGDGGGDTWHPPSLVGSAGFLPGSAPSVRPVSLRRHGDHLFLRAKVTADPRQR